MLAFVELPLEKLSGLTSSQKTVQPGKKLNEKNKKVRRPFPRNIEKYADLSFDNDEQDEALCMEKFEVIFIQTTTILDIIYLQNAQYQQKNVFS